MLHSELGRGRHGEGRVHGVGDEDLLQAQGGRESRGQLAVDAVRVREVDRHQSLGAGAVDEAGDLEPGQPEFGRDEVLRFVVAEVELGDVHRETGLGR